MSITTLTSGASSSNLSAYSSASVTPTASRLYVAFFVCSSSSAPTPTVTAAGCGLTWTLVDRNDTTFTRSGYLFYATGTPSAGAVTFTGSAGMTAGLWVVAEMDGADLSSPIVQFVKARAGGNELAVSQAFDSAVSAANEAIALVGFEGTQEASVPGTGWTLVADEVIGQPSSSLSVQFADPPVQDITASWTTANRWYVIGAEIRAAGGGTVTGAGAGTATAFTGSGSGALSLSGSGAATAAPVAADGSGALETGGAGEATIAAFAASGSGALTVTGAGAASAATFEASGAGDVTEVGGVSGSGAAVASALTASGTGALRVAGGGGATVAPFTVSAVGTLTVVGSGALAAQAVTAAATGLIRSVGDGAATTQPFAAAGAGTVSDPAAYRDIAVTYGPGRSRSLAADAGASRRTTATGRSRSLTATPRT